MQTRGLAAGNQIAHADDARERNLRVRDIDYVIRHQWRARDEDRANYAEVFDVLPVRVDKGAQFRARDRAQHVDRCCEEYLVEVLHTFVVMHVEAAARSWLDTSHRYTGENLYARTQNAACHAFENGLVTS